MACLLPKISTNSTFPPQRPSRNAFQKLLFSTSAAAAATKLDLPALAVDALREKPPSLHEKPPVLQQRSPNVGNNSDGNKDEFYLNLGVAVRTLREDLPALFSKDLNYHIYRSEVPRMVVGQRKEAGDTDLGGHRGDQRDARMNKEIRRQPEVQATDEIHGHPARGVEDRWSGSDGSGCF